MNLNTEKQTPKLAVAMTKIELQNPGLVAFFDIRSGDGAGLFYNLEARRIEFAASSLHELDLIVDALWHG